MTVDREWLQQVELDVDGVIDAKGVRFIGKARKQTNGLWRCLADVDGCLCIIEAHIHPTPAAPVARDDSVDQRGEPIRDLEQAGIPGGSGTVGRPDRQDNLKEGDATVHMPEMRDAPHGRDDVFPVVPPPAGGGPVGGESKQVRCFARTVEHIHRVQKNMLLLVTTYRKRLMLDDNDCRMLMHNVMLHDRSKFSKDQWDGYVELGEYFRQRKTLGNEDYEYRPGAKELSEAAWRIHYSVENHHPEQLQGELGMWDRYQALEAACDLQAMAQEFGEGSCRKYWTETWLPKQSKNFYDDYNYEQVRATMDEAIQCFEGEVEKKLDNIAEMVREANSPAPSLDQAAALIAEARRVAYDEPYHGEGMLPRIALDLADLAESQARELQVKRELFKVAAKTHVEELAAQRKLLEQVKPRLLHFHRCPWRVNKPCTCGLDDLRREIEEAVKPT